MVDSKKFNLTTDPWIKVVTTETNQEKKISLIELFENASRYQQLAGDMHSQDLALLRLLLAILTTVYSRVDANGEQYSWLDGDMSSPEDLEIDLDAFDDDDGEDTLFSTWGQLYHTGHFSSAVTDYLAGHAADFEFFGDRPFYQASTEDYDALVPENRKVAAGKGQVLVKQMNRRISESANTPDIFTPKSGDAKNKVSLDELVRWVITYQNFTGVTDKTKVVTEEKFSNSGGWIYRLNPVFAKGKTLFDTLMLNLVLVDTRQDSTEYALQQPVWEAKSVRDYVAQRKAQILPDNLSELYTTWSRLLHIEWQDGQPTILSAGIPTFAYEDALIEPMTTWKFDKKTNAYRPAGKSLRSLGIAMWRNFGQYVKVRREDDMHEPGIVIWLRALKQKQLIAHDAPLYLNSVALISDGNATSQSPAVEVVDDMALQADVLFDDELAERWPLRIEEVIETTQTIGNDYYHFATDIGKIRNLDTRTFANGMSAKFYERLNEPFKAWLGSLSGQDDRDAKINLWKATLEKIVVMAVDNDMQASSPRDVRGISDNHGQPLNIFTAKNHLMYNVRRDLNLKKE
ncbi:type I-E CRISPR-associated protein Cse1/CasA [Levilactobacillus fujinensis]|uniref:Type I-E CRISPR-associated protein Cse1/CasA n=1 Tax=Levilactobacillus fujinensis TaxID=2486024 RepID=A0ABW1TIB5_9LACO|nr:type I-E CRISPR-associated protein Cse1/CasA [Levilactobacillus fujinensis]